MATIGETFRQIEGGALAAVSGAAEIEELYLSRALLQPGLEDFAKATLTLFNSPVQSLMYLLQIIPDIAKGAETGDPLGALTMLFVSATLGYNIVKGIKMASK